MSSVFEELLDESVFEELLDVAVSRFNSLGTGLYP